MERILVIRRHNHIGDMLCSVPLYAGLKKRWPSAEITLLASPTRYPIPLRDVNPFLDRVEYYAKGTLTEVIRAHTSLRSRGFDVAIVPSTIALSRTSHITALLSGARVRVGVGTLDGKRNPMHRFLNVKGDMHWGTEHVHQEERNREIAALAGCGITQDEMRAFRIPLTDKAEGKATHVLGDWADGRPLIGVHPGAGKMQNIWPAERYAEVLGDLAFTNAGDVVITGGVLDDAAVEALGARLTIMGIEHRKLRNLPIAALSAVYQRLRLYLTNDTGTMHIAAYSGCRTVSLFGPTASWEWGPRGDHHRVVQSDDGSMGGIPIDSVRMACQSLLGD
ncbi:MAG: glycosyltransferase family 9 protein [Bacteroidetes bacterium]|nr:glycosyltransferase family 9 protein [Bacteroidota bacterium]